MGLRITCPECGEGLKVPEAKSGRRVICPQCGEAFRAAESAAFGSAQQPLSLDDETDTRIRAAEKAVRPAAKLLHIMWMLALFPAIGFAMLGALLVASGGGDPDLDGRAPLMVVLGIIYPVVTALGIVGVRRMQRLRSYPWALASAGLMAVAFMGYMAGVIVGAWVLTVLARPQVREAFEANEERGLFDNEDEDD